MTTEGPSAAVPFRFSAPDEELDELRRRLRETRWPEEEPVADGSQGFPLRRLQTLCRYWAESYDWRRVEAQLNAAPQYRMELDGLGIHFLHARSPHPEALPLVLTHGWPGSVVEYLDLLGPLTDPVAHGGDAADAFHVVVPSLPGYGFSDRPAEPGWGLERIAGAWAQLLTSLGYDRYGAAGTDWGTSVSSLLGALAPERVVGIHLVPPLAAPDPATFDSLTPSERAALDETERRSRTGSAYSEVHRTRPQTIGYSLVDSPAGLAAWIGEKFWSWADHDGDLDTAIGRDRLLDDITLYWLTRTGASAARLYRESIGVVARWLSEPGVDPVPVPTGCSIFAKESPRPSRRWAARRYPDIRYWAEHERGGHFRALEQPAALVADLRAFFRLVRP